MSDRELRKLLNVKQDNIVTTDHYPGNKNIPEGQMLLAHPKGKPARLYKKLKGMLWWKNLTRDGNEYVDKDLKVDKNLTIGRHRKEVLQPSFSYYNSSSDTNIGTYSWTTIDFDTKLFDVGDNFASDTFTAPVAGKYLLNTQVTVNSLDSAASSYILRIVTAKNDYYSYRDVDKYFDADSSWHTLPPIFAICDFDKDDTAQVRIYQGAGTSQTDIIGHADNQYTYFSGYLLG